MLVDATEFFLRDAHGVARAAAERGTGQVPARRRAQRALPGADEGVPEEHRGRGHADVHDRRRARAARRGRRPRHHRRSPSASITRSSSCPDAHYTPRKLDPRAPSFGIEFYDYASPINAPIEKRWIARHRLEKKDPAAGRLRAGQADRLLRRYRRARADPVRAAGRGVVVEPGVRGGRIPECVPGQGAARRRRPDGRPLQHDPLGPPLDPRLVVRRRRSSIRAPARSSRATSRSARCASGRTS